MTLEQIQAAIPHRAPMLLVDEIVDLAGDSITCRKHFRLDEFFVQGHYPGQPIVPGVILCEAVVQAGAILLAQRVTGQPGVPVLTRMNDVKFRRIVRPGETVELIARLNEHLGDAFFLTGTVKIDGQTAMRLEFACTLANASENRNRPDPRGEAAAEKVV